MSKWSDLWDVGSGVGVMDILTTKGTRYYRVRMLGWARFLFWPRVNIKRIDIIGHVINLWFWKWGEALAYPLPGYWDMIFDNKILGLPPYLLSYDEPDNNYFIRRIRDWLRGIPAEEFLDDQHMVLLRKILANPKRAGSNYICQFRYDFTGMPIFGRLGERRICFFLLERIDNYHGGDL